MASAGELDFRRAALMSVARALARRVLKFLPPAQADRVRTQWAKVGGWRAARGPCVLLYHRIAERDPDPWALNVSPRHFNEQMEVLRRYRHPTPLTRIAAPEGCRDPKSVAVTFDDGYADNLDAAKPVLERHQVPATVFVMSGAVDRRSELWWDELERILLVPERLPAKLRMMLGSREFSWPEGEAPAASGADERNRLHRAVYDLLLPLRQAEKERIVAELRGWAGMEGEIGRPARRLLRRDELCSLAAGSLIEIGGHTKTHAMLSALSPGDQFAEIAAGKAEIETILGRKITAFSYPYGNYNTLTMTLVREAGFTLACHTRPGAVRRHTNRFALPRIHVQDWDGDEFRRFLTTRGKAALLPRVAIPP